MSVLNKIAQKCEQKYLATNRMPYLVRLPKADYDTMFQEMKGVLRLPPREEVYGELASGGYGWRMETAEEYSARINEKPRQIILNLSFGSLTVIPYNGSEVVVELESTN